MRTTLAILSGLTLAAIGPAARAEHPEGGAYGTAELPIGAPAPLAVSPPPPALPPEQPLACPAGTLYVPGRWDWNGAWSYVPAACMPAQSNYVYVAPTYVGRYYTPGHWGLRGHGPVFRPRGHHGWGWGHGGGYHGGGHDGGHHGWGHGGGHGRRGH